MERVHELLWWEPACYGCSPHCKWSLNLGQENCWDTGNSVHEKSEPLWAYTVTMHLTVLFWGFFIPIEQTHGCAKMESVSVWENSLLESWIMCDRTWASNDLIQQPLCRDLHWVIVIPCDKAESMTHFGWASSSRKHSFTTSSEVSVNAGFEVKGLFPDVWSWHYSDGCIDLCSVLNVVYQSIFAQHDPPFPRLASVGIRHQTSMDCNSISSL